MKNRFEWISRDEIHKDVRGSETRWAIMQETIRDTVTGDIFQRSMLRHPGVAAIVPINNNREILLIEQFRYSADRVLWEIPAGTLHGEYRDGKMVATEAPESAAQRELIEEAGLHAQRLQYMQSFYVMPGTSDGIVHLFLAFDLTTKIAPSDVGEVVTNVKPFTLDQLTELISSGAICDAKTIIGIQCAIQFLTTYDQQT